MTSIIENRTPGTSDVIRTSARTGDLRILLMGPAGGSLGGAIALFHVFLDAFEATPGVNVKIIDTAPPANAYYYRSRLVGSETVRRAGSIIAQFKNMISQVDAVIFFANKDLALSVGPILLGIARLHNKPLYLKTIAGNLALGIEALRSPMRQYAVRVFNSFAGILAETQLVQKELEALGCRNVHYVPNCRAEQSAVPPRDFSAGDERVLKLVFLSQINRRKGVFVILDALTLLNQRGSTQVTCDFFGPLFPDIEAEFMNAIAQVPNARYHGAVAQSEALSTLAQFDALIVPTYHVTEGHPGIIIEAMQVGVPIISTRLRAIPELITPGENGLLVAPEDVTDLANAIEVLAKDRSALVEMGRKSYMRRHEFSSTTIVGEVLDILRKGGTH